MHFRTAMLVSAVAVAALLSAGCEHKKKHEEPKHTVKTPEMPAASKTAVATIKPSGIAATRPTKNVTGTVTFSQVKDGVKVIAQLSGLQPNSKHGIHIHEKADLSAPNL